MVSVFDIQNGYNVCFLYYYLAELDHVIFAGPKRGRPSWGFQDFVITSPL